jgi:hypothetical protein
MTATKLPESEVLREAVYRAEKMLEDGNEELARRVLRDALKRGER